MGKKRGRGGRCDDRETVFLGMRDVPMTYGLIVSYMNDFHGLVALCLAHPRWGLNAIRHFKKLRKPQFAVAMLMRMCCDQYNTATGLRRGVKEWAGTYFLDESFLCKLAHHPRATVELARWVTEQAAPVTHRGLQITATRHSRVWKLVAWNDRSKKWAAGPTLRRDMADGMVVLYSGMVPDLESVCRVIHKSGDVDIMMGPAKHERIVERKTLQQGVIVRYQFEGKDQDMKCVRKIYQPAGKERSAECVLMNISQMKPC